MQEKIHVDKHAAYRIIARACEFGLDLDETNARIRHTIVEGHQAKRHCSRRNTTKCRYFSDNLTFFVVFHRKKEDLYIKTVIIEYGRQ
jgi:hypothetical protein